MASLPYAGWANNKQEEYKARIRQANLKVSEQIEFLQILLSEGQCLPYEVFQPDTYVIDLSFVHLY